jgi:multiple sugar transport system ATP-binding protein
MNFIDGRLRVSGGTVGLKLPDGTEVPLTGYEFSGKPEDGRSASLGVRPEQIDLKTHNGASTLPVTVVLIDPMGADSLLWGSVGKDTISVRIGAEDTYRMGESLKASFQPSGASLFDAESGARL